MPEIPFRINKTRTGQIRVKYHCPGCNAALESELAESGTNDRCPDCGGEFRVPGAEKRREVEKMLALKAQKQREEKERQAAENATQIAAQAKARPAAIVQPAEAAAPPQAAPVAQPYAPPSQQILDVSEAMRRGNASGNTSYPALELYRFLLRAIGWVFICIGVLGFVGISILGFSGNSPSQLPMIVEVISTIVMGGIWMIWACLMAMAMFVCAEFISLSLDNRRDIAKIVENTER